MVLFRSGTRILIVSEKEDKADELVERIWIMYKHLPPMWKQKYPAKRSKCLFEIKNNYCTIKSLPAGSDQARSYTATMIFLDEFAFQENQDKTMRGLGPSIRKGRIFIVSTPNGHTRFEEIIKDKRLSDKHTAPQHWYKPEFKNDLELDLREIVHDDTKLRMRRNPNNGYLVIDIPYDEMLREEVSARGLVGSEAKQYIKDWETRAYQDVGSEDGWQVEYKRNFDITLGKRVYPEFTVQRHIRKIIYNPYLPLLRGWDFGYHRPAITWAQIDDKNGLPKFYGLHEFLGEDMLIFDLIPYVQKRTHELFPDVVEFEDYVDPAGSMINDKSMKSSVDVMLDAGLRPVFRRTPVLQGIDIMRDLQRSGRFILNETCEITKHAMLGGYAYPEAKEGKPQDENPFKDGYYDNICDSWRYIVINKLDLFNSPAPTKERPPFISPILNNRAVSAYAPGGEDRWYNAL